MPYVSYLILFYNTSCYSWTLAAADRSCAEWHWRQRLELHQDLWMLIQQTIFISIRIVESKTIQKVNHFSCKYTSSFSLHYTILLYQTSLQILPHISLVPNTSTDRDVFVHGCYALGYSSSCGVRSPSWIDHQIWKWKRRWSWRLVHRQHCWSCANRSHPLQGFGFW